jgi:hypothetical protein
MHSWQLLREHLWQDTDNKKYTPGIIPGVLFIIYYRTNMIMNVGTTLTCVYSE